MFRLGISSSIAAARHRSLLRRLAGVVHVATILDRPGEVTTLLRDADPRADPVEDAASAPGLTTMDPARRSGG
jgi:hypothetical protein